MPQNKEVVTVQITIVMTIKVDITSLTAYLVSLIEYSPLYEEIMTDVFFIEK
jgi:hypothetical protein